MLRLNEKFALKSLLAATALLLANGAAWAQSAALTAAPAAASLPDGSVVPMWGYSCGTVTGTGVSCVPLNPNAGTGWSPVVITVPYTADSTGASTTNLTINLTNNLSFTPAGGTTPTTIPTSLTIVGQLGGGLGSGGTSTPSPDHTNAQPLTWPIAGDAPGAPVTGVGTPPAQNPRVQSFGTEVLAAGATAGTNQCVSPCALTWNKLRPGTYLIESGTHPSIQGPMGLYGILIVTTAPNGTTAGTAYGTPGTATAVSYNSEVPLILSEIDPVQNSAVSAAVVTAGFVETNVWAGLSAATTTVPSAVLCRSVTGGAAPNGACYPPAVNYTPLYYLINGVTFDRTHNTNSLFASTVGTALAPVSGTVLVRLVNAGLRMHVPAIVGSQTAGVDSTGAAATVAGFTLVAEDGNQLPPARPRVQSEVFMPAGKTSDALINVPTSAAPLPVYDRELSLSGNATERDAGMLAYIGINGASLPTSGAFAPLTVTAVDDSYFLVAPNALVVSDPAKGLIANDLNVYGVQVLAPPAGGSLSLNANGTFTYVPNTGTTTDSFTYCANGSVTAGACSSGFTATVSLAACGTGCKEASTDLTVTALTFTANGTFLRIQPPGILSGITDPAGHPLTVTAGSVTPTGASVTADANGGFFASVGSCAPVAPATNCPATFTYTATTSQGVVSPTNTVTIYFLPASNVNVTVLDGKDVLAARQNAPTCVPGTPGTKDVNGCVTPAVITDYRWVIEEDRTFYVNPNCTTNPPAAGCPGTSTAGLGITGIVPTFGTNFHSSHMPVVATGCTGSVSCEGGQTIYDPVSGTHINAVCDQGNGVCRPDSTASGFTATFPAQVHLDPSKRYYISVLPGDAATPFENTNLSADCTNGTAAATNPGTCGHGMGGAPITCQLSGTEVACSAADGFAPVTILTEPSPYPPSKLSVFVFEDDFPLNGEQDGGGGVDVLSPNEPGLGGFNITLFDDAGGSGDATGQMTYDMFNQPLSNSLAGTIDPATGLDACPISKISRIGAQDPTQTGITGTIVTCPKYESDQKTLSPIAGQAVIANLMPGRYGVVATPGADAIARGEEWLQTNTLDGQKAHDSFLRIGEPSFFQEFGPAGFHVSIGFANPAIINARRQYICNGSDPNSPQPGTPYTCNNTVTGQVTTERMSRTPDERLYSSGDYTSFGFTQCYVSLGDPDAEDFAFTKCNADGTFTLSGLPEGNWRITVFDQWNDMLVDGLSTPVLLGGGQTVPLGQIAMNQWQTNIYTTTFFDNNYNGVRDATESGLTLVATNNRFRDGSFSNFNNTDLSGNAGFNEIFPLFSWYVIETDSTRFKNTGTHVVYDAGGPADGTPCGNATSPPTAPCGSSNIGAGLANTAEIVPVPVKLRVPGAVYCPLGADGTGADCASSSISNGPFVAGGSSGPTPGTCTISPSTGQTTCSGTQMSTGRIDPPWVTSEAWQGFSGENQIVEFGKKPYVAGENGGIRGHVIYASTRPFDDPQLLLQTSWEPLVPNVRINLYKVGTAADGTQSLTLADWTTTSSWDDWAQGFRSDGIPNMNCPGQLAQPTSGAAGDLFYFTLYNQPMWLDLYNSQHGGAAPTALPNNAQFKCYDGMHNWNQVQPAPYDGMYQFPSVTGRNPVTGNTTGTNCTVCVKDPDSTDPFRGGKEDMLPAGQYVVEVVVPPGFELVKEEDKNILIGDNFIAPATVQFPGLGGSIYILPDQASVAAQYNANQGGLAAYNGTNMQNPAQALGRISSLPSHEGDTGSVESFWPCVGASRIVPDYISLFPGSAEVAPFAGAVRNLCDRKLVQLDDQTQALAKFYVFTSTHTAAHFTGVITDDFTSEFDPFSPQFGEKFSPANLPVAIKDWTGQEVSRVYADQWGTYNGLTYSTWEVNPPNPTGYSPTMMVTCMNDAGPGPTPDPLYNSAYSQFCYEIPFMPAQTQYMDTPVVPTSAFAGAGYNNADCDYPDATPAISEVDVDSNIGPWVNGAGSTHTVNIYALGTVSVNNYAYSGPAANTAPFNAKTVLRKYTFGATAGTVALVSPPNSAGNTTTVTLTGVTWGDLAITAPVPVLPNAFNCPLQQQVQYGGPGNGTPAKCAQLMITAANGRQSVDAVTITIGGKAPTHIAPTASIQSAIDAAKPGDMLIIDPATRATSTTPAGAAVHQELLLMWKPIRLQGVGAAASIINGNSHPAGKLDVWRRQVNCLFGLSIDGYQSLPGGTPFTQYDPSGAYACGANANFGAGATTLFGFHPTATNPQVDRLPLEAVIGWNAGLNGNLAELLQEPSLMGALEGAAITVLSKGVFIPNGATDVFGATSATAGSYPTGTLLVTGGGNQTRGCGNDQPGTNGFHPNPFPSNFQCNPSSIDGLTIENSSQGGGGIFVHGWGHNLQIANNRVTNNSGTLSGGVNVGQGEFPGAYTIGGINADPGSCQTSGYAPNTELTGKQLPYCFDLNVNMHHNMITKNSSTGDELFSATPAGAGGVSICNGSDYYRFNYNWVCGNLSTGDGGGVGHLGYSYNGDIEHNSILFNQSTNPTIATNGGGLLIMGAPDADPTCGIVTDVDCLPTPVNAPSDGVGPGLTVNANLIQGNGAESGSGGGLRLQHVNGTDVTTFPTQPLQWYAVNVTNNIIVNNVAGWDGGGISLLDALDVNIVNNTIMSNDTTASSGMLFNTLGAPRASGQGPCPVARNPDGSCPLALTTSTPQPAGLVTIANSSQLATAMAGLPASAGGVRWTCPTGHFSGTGSANNANCGRFSYPLLYNDVIWQNRSFSIHISGLGTGPLNQQNVVALQPTLSQTSTGFCASEPGFSATSGGYWEVGVRGDTAPNTAGTSGNSSGGAGAFTNPRLAPRFSILTDAADYPSLSDLGSNPAVVKQYCNGARVPPENGGLGYDVPPGIADATVPNPIFSLTPAATVDEGNNWINMAWGPLSVSDQAHPHTAGAGDTTLGNYAIGAGSPAVNAGSASQSGIAAPTTDFFGTTRPQGGAWDVGAVELGGGGGGGCSVTVAPSTLAFGTQSDGGSSAPMTVTLTNGCTTRVSGGTYVFGGGTPQPFARASVLQGGAGSCGTSGSVTLAAGASCTINVVFAPSGTQSGAFSRTLTIGGFGATITGSPVTLTGTAQSARGTLAFSSATNGTLATVLGVRTLTFTIPAPRAAVTSVVTVTNTGTGPLAITAETLSLNVGALYSITAQTCTGSPLAAGGTCSINIQYATPTTRPALPDIGATAVSNNGSSAVGGTSTLALVAQ